MVHIEFIGLPGSGKSTLRTMLVESLCRRKIPCLSMDQALLSCLKIHVDGIFFKYFLHILPEKTALKYAPLVFTRSALRYTAQNAFLSTNSQAVAAILSSDHFLSAAPQEREMLLSWFFLTASQYQVIRENMSEKMPVIFDEGFLQRAVSLLVSPGGKSLPETTFLSSYLDLIPRPDIVLYLRTDQKTCIQRINTRSKGMPERLAGKNQQDIQSFMDTYAGCIQNIIDLATTKDFNITSIDNNGRPEAAAYDLQQVILSHTMKAAQV
jgi:thymidylate kinase